jgi:hypothetical protein
LVAAALHAVPAKSFEIAWHSVDGGGALHATGGSFELSGAIGQADAGGAMTGGTFSLTGGFWGGSTTGAPTPGDCDSDGDVDLADHAAFAACLHGPEGGLSANCDCLDFDGDGDSDLADFAAFQIGYTGP